MVLILPKNNHNSGREKGWAKCWEQQIIKGKNWIKIILSKTTSMTERERERGGEREREQNSERGRERGRERGTKYKLD